ncbi:MAG: VWA-like domain-containing protein [Acidobacteriia bacterium]|nr:VWA-like domain-containing protein [Terriglobia bacterium]
MRIQTSVERKLTRARTQLLLNQPFFGTLCLRLKLAPGNLPTMATDGRRIVYDPAFVDALKPAELEAVLAHEVLHCALGHHCRRGERDPQIWNQAADLAINPILVSNGFALPAGALLDPAFDNLSAEEIYTRLLQRSKDESSATPEQTPQPPGAGSGGGNEQGAQGQQTSDSESSTQNPSAPNQDASGNRAESQPPRLGGFGEVWDATDEQGGPASQAENSRQQQEWNIAADQAMRSAKSCGHEPANLDRPLNESRQPMQDWRAILRAFVAAIAPSDYRWTPPNRRYVASGLYLPSVERTGLGTIVVGVDTSGSIGEEELKQFAGEISAISEEAKPEGIHVVYCDATVQSSQEFGPSESIQLKPRGGGGTDFRPVFEWVNENQISPVCLIYLTDLCCYSYPPIPEYPVLWVTDSRRTAPFGETVRITLD